MGCDRFRVAISARADGEDPGVPDQVLDDHLIGCPDCRAFSDATHRLRRHVGLYDVGAVPDLSRDVVQRTAQDDRRRTVPVIRWLLGLVAVQIIVLAIPDLVSDQPDAHSLRHLGAFSVAYAVGLLVVVARPARARTMLSVAVVLVAALAVTTAVDVIQGRVPLVNETVHLLEVCSAVFLWILARPRTDLSAREGSERSTSDVQPTGLRAVADDES